MTPTQRTLRELRERGIECDVVERFIKRHGQPHGIRRDLFNLVDVFGMDPEREQFVGVQCFGASGGPSHRAKVLEHKEKAALWLKCRGRLELWCWRKVKLCRGSKAIRWRPRIEVITLEDLA